MMAVVFCVSIHFQGGDMATQGMISVQSDEGEVFMKIVAGSDGYMACVVAAWLEEFWPVNVEEVYRRSLDAGFGTDRTLVVMTSDEIMAPEGEEVNDLYYDTFQDPNFNPRWKCGTADFVEIVQV